MLDFHSVGREEYAHISFVGKFAVEVPNLSKKNLGLTDSGEIFFGVGFSTSTERILKIIIWLFII